MNLWQIFPRDLHVLITSNYMNVHQSYFWIVENHCSCLKTDKCFSSSVSHENSNMDWNAVIATRAKLIHRFNKLRLYSWWYQLVIKKNSFSDAWFVIYFLINACISSTWNNHKKNYTRCQLIYNDCNDCTSIYIHGPHSIQQGDVLIVL